jgi:hypothetical protein
MTGYQKYIAVVWEAADDATGGAPQDQEYHRELMQVAADIWSMNKDEIRPLTRSQTYDYVAQAIDFSP